VIIVEDGTIRQYPGDFEDYKNELVREIAAEMDEDE
jgi:ATP-binding cassette subfamily F protein 1